MNHNILYYLQNYKNYKVVALNIFLKIFRLMLLSFVVNLSKIQSSRKVDNFQKSTFSLV